jgi:DeoR/GlpR family transcriptional regulator of sugar metabolism
VSVQDLAAHLSTSAATIRRDVIELAEKGQVTRSHGGVTLRIANTELPYEAKAHTLLPEKRRIGAAAAKGLVDGQTVAFGGGTTVIQMVRAAKRMALTVWTTAINVALELNDAPNIAVWVTGGMLQRGSSEMVGFPAERSLRDTYIDIAAIGVDGYSAERGLSAHDPIRAYTNRVLLEQAKEVWVLADHTKIGQVRPSIIDDVHAVTRLYTDVWGDGEHLKPFQDLGIEVIQT